MSGRRGKISQSELEFNEAVSFRVTVFMQRRGLNRADLASAAGMRSSHLFAYFSGTTRWSVFRLQLIARRLGVQVADLLPSNKSM